MKTVDECLGHWAKGDVSFVHPEHIAQMAQIILSLRGALRVVNKLTEEYKPVPASEGSDHA